MVHVVGIRLNTFTGWSSYSLILYTAMLHYYVVVLHISDRIKFCGHNNYELCCVFIGHNMIFNSTLFCYL